MKKIFRKIPFSPPDINKKEVLQLLEETIESGWITTGPKTKELERKIADYCGTDKSVCLNSATAGLELTLRLLNIGPGDEVITSAYTYTASCSVIIHTGATPVMVDTKPNSFEIDPVQLASKITSKTKAIIGVDFAGKITNYDEIFKVIDEKKVLYIAGENIIQETLNRIILIADAAHSFGAIKDGKPSGKHSDFTVFSFHAVKNLTTAEGGAVIWNLNNQYDSELIYKQFQILSLHGQTKDALSKMQLGSWEYDIVEAAYKCNMTDLHASIGLSQLKNYDIALNYRHELYNEYILNLDSKYIEVLKHIDTNQKSSTHLLITRVNGINEEQRNNIIEKMALEGIATNVHYKPLPMLTAYKKLGFNILDFPNSFNQYKNEITLPLYTLLKKEDIQYICEKYNEIVKGIVNL